MRIIPKKTRVRMQFFRNIGIADMAVILVGGLVAFTVLLSGLPFRLPIFIMLLTITIGLVMSIDDEKPYMTALNAIRYLARIRVYTRESAFGDPSAEEEPVPADGKKKKKKKVQAAGKLEDIIPFTGIRDEYIEYGTDYVAAVVEISAVEFRLYSLARQNAVIDQVFAPILRSVALEETASLVKIDRPMLYDDVLKSEEKKLEALKKAYVHGSYSDEELTERVGIIQDRIAQIRRFNERDRVLVPCHYLVFYRSSRELLKQQVDNMLQSMNANEIPCRQLKGAELAIFLKYNYAQGFDEREAYSLQPEQYMDWILPKEIRFAPRTVCYDGLYTHNVRVKEFPSEVGNAWGAALFNIPYTRVVMKIRPIEHTKAVRQIDRALQELQEQAAQTDKASRIMELDTHIQTIAQVLRLLQGDNEILFNTDLFVTAYDYEYTEDLARWEQERKDSSAGGRKKPESKMKKDLRRGMSELGFRTSDMLLQQFEGYASSSISANDSFLADSHSIHAGSVAAAFPYVIKYLNDENGIYIGDSSGVPAFVNFFMRNRERVNSNVVIIGKSGSGKSFATKTILTHLTAENAKIFILDPENEYTKMAKAFHGKVIDVGTAAQGRLNPFHVITNLADDEADDELGLGTQQEGASLNTHLQFLEEFYRQILPGIDRDALEYLNNLTVQVYAEKGIDTETDLSKLGPEDYPTFDDVYDKLINDFQMTTGEYAKTNLRILINYIYKFVEGGRDSNLWNGPATLNTNENFIVFNFQSLLANKNNLVANAQMLLVMKWLDNEIIKNRDYNLRYNADRRIIVVIDEAHVFIDDKYPIALDFMYQLAKRIRKYNGMQIVITQNIKDFVGTEELARKSTAIINASQYSFIFPLSPNDMSDLVKLYEKAGAINETEQEDIVNNGRGRAFLITAPQARTNVEIIADPEIRKLFTMT